MIPSGSTYLNCMALNCQSLTPKIDTVIDIIKCKSVDVCFLTETWCKKAKNATTKLIEEYGYRSFHSNDFGRGKGTAVLLNTKFRYKKVVLNHDFTSFDAVVLHLTNSTCLVCLYRYYRWGSAFDLFLSEFSTLLSDLVLCCDSLVICGDVNVHVNDPSNSYTEKFTDTLDEFDLRCLTPFVPTQIRGNTLDLVIANALVIPDIKDLEVESHYPLGDHHPTFFSIDNAGDARNVYCNPRRLVRHIKKIDMSVFRSDLQMLTSDALTALPDSFESAVQSYNGSLLKCLDKHAPQVSSNVVYRDRPKWMDHEYVLERAERRRLERVYKRCRTPLNKLRLSKQTKLCSNMAKRKRKLGIQNDVISCADNQKALINLLDSWTGNSKSRKLPEVYGDDNDLAHNFNKFFTDKINNIRSSFNISDSLSYPPDDVSNENSSMYLSNFQPTDTEEISSIMKKYGIKVSPADIFPEHLLSGTFDILLPFVTDLVNLSLSTGSISGLTEAVVRPLLKAYNLDINLFNNFRPVSNLEFLGKLIERVVQSRLQNHMSNINYCNNTQFGYKKSHSTELLLLKFMNDILVGIDGKNGVVVLLIDLSAAFDTVDNKKLLNILYNELHICGTALQWFKSFLCNRSQRVLIGTCSSESIELTCGVPQGSVLGPILFNIYVNSLSNIFTENGYKTLSYADDNSGYQVFSLTSTTELFNVSIPNCISRLRTWMDEFFLKINEDKTQIIVFGRPTFHRDFNLTEVTLNNGDIVEITDRIKYLGFHFDKFLSLTTHVNKVVSHSYLLLRNIRKMRRFLTQPQAQLLVQCVITSRIDYCNVLLFGAQKVACINKLQRVQNQASRIVLQKGRLQGFPSNLRLQMLHWLSIEKRIIFKALVIIYNCYNHTAPVLLSSLLVRKFPTSLVTDDDFNCDFRTELFYPSYSIGRRSFQYYAPRLWNSLPVELCAAPTKEAFKKKLKTYLWESFDVLMYHFNGYRNM